MSDAGVEEAQPGAARDVPAPGQHDVPAPGRDLGASRMSRRLVALFAVAAGFSVANLYYAQPLLPLLRRYFGVSTGVTALAATLTQLGFVFGLLLVLPLGDLVVRRRLIPAVMIACAIALGLAASAPSIAVLLAALFLVGLTASVGHLLVPFAASLAQVHERGRVIGMVMSGLLVGILLARTLAGSVAEIAGWRTMFYLAAGFMVVLAAVMSVSLPGEAPRAGPSYIRLLVSLVEIFRTEPVVRRRAGYGALAFGCFNVLWTSIAFLLAGPPYHYGSGRIGLFGLLGVAGILMAGVAGRLADRGWVRQFTAISALCMAVAFGPIYLGAHSLVALMVGVAVVDGGVQGMQITNQSQIYLLRPELRSRINAVYMICFFTGGALTSALVAALYPATGWTGVSVLGGALGTTALVAALLALRRPQPSGTGASGPGRAPGLR